MIARIWHGYTNSENAGAYEDLLKNEIFPSIENENVKGYKKISLFKQAFENEVKFMTIMLFDDLDSVKEFVGEEYQKAYVPEKAQRLLKQYDKTSQHFEIVEEITIPS